APGGGLLVTIQLHMNVIAVASHAGLSGVVFAAGRAPEEPVRRKAVEERIALFLSERSAFDVVGELYALGIRGPRV
ncbi:MAG: serine kinase, partial [Planctomycetota bacterium]